MYMENKSLLNSPSYNNNNHIANADLQEKIRYEWMCLGFPIFVEQEERKYITQKPKLTNCHIKTQYTLFSARIINTP